MCTTGRHEKEDRTAGATKNRGGKQMKKKTGSREPGAGSRASQRLCFWQGHSEKVEKSSSKGFFFFFTLPARPKTTDTHASEIHKTNIRLNIQNIQKKKKKKVRKTEQIVEDRAEPQQIVATRPLYCLQHPLPIQVVCKRFFPAHIDIAIHEVDSRPFRPLPVPRQLWYTSIRDALFLLISYKRDPTSSLPAQILA